MNCRKKSEKNEIEVHFLEMIENCQKKHYFLIFVTGLSLCGFSDLDSTVIAVANVLLKLCLYHAVVLVLKCIEQCYLTGIFTVSNII